MQSNDIGFLTFAQNSSTVDYLELAYLQALNCRSTHPEFKYAVIVDHPTSQVVQDKHRQVFDHIIQKPLDTTNAMNNEWQAYWHTPFFETIKLEADLLFTRNIAHWLPALRMKEVVLSTGCRNYKDQLSGVRNYRRFIDDNDLPDVYNGLMYFRKGAKAEEFFTLAKNLYFNWKTVTESVLLNYREDQLSTDIHYAVTAQVFGREHCTLPLDYINFVHMKPAVNNFSTERAWFETVMHERDGDMIRINNLNQYHPVHYYDKNYATAELIKYYEQRTRVL
jgi:hypothetical protein